ncbi:hypothetical protein D0T56_11525 [Dysgonomonas sp. 520]|nr:hypothetical protein [Dysgonomonas sp. 520]
MFKYFFFYFSGGKDRLYSSPFKMLEYCERGIPYIFTILNILLDILYATDIHRYKKSDIFVITLNNKAKTYYE